MGNKSVQKVFILGIMCLLLLLCGCQKLGTFDPENKNITEMPRYNKDIPFDSLTEGELLSVDKESVSDVIEGLYRPENYIWESVVEYRGGGSVMSLKCFQYVKGAKARLESYVGDYRYALYVTDGKTLYSYGQGSSKPYKSPMNDEFGYDTMINIAEIGRVMPKNSEDIKDTYLTVLDGKYVVYFEVNDEETNMTDKFWLSFDYGVPLRAESYINDKLSYALVTSSFVETEPSEEFFEIS